MLTSNDVLTNPEFVSDMDGQALMYNGLIELGYSEVMARWAVIDGGGSPRYDALEIQSARDDLARLSALRERFLSTAET